MKLRRVFFWKVAGLLLIAIVVAVVSRRMWGESVASRKWQSLDRRVAELRAELEVLRGTHPVLRGTPVPGKAWDDYLRAVSALKNADVALLQDFVDRKLSQWDRGTVQRAVGDQAAALEFLRSGARRAESGAPRLPWGTGGVGLDRPKMRAQDLANVAISRSRFLIEEGRAQEAVELLMDLSQFGQDVRRMGRGDADGEGDFVFHQALREIKDLVVSGPLPPEVLVQLDQELAILDAASPRESLKHLHELETTGSALLDGTYDEKVFDRSWRNGFSRRLAAAEKFERFDTWVREVVATEAAAWPREKQLCDKVREEDTEDEIVPRLVFPGKYRLVFAHLRMVRVAARYRATGEIADLEDPFGSRIRTRLVGRKLKIWSVGRDGFDHGGRGYWQPVDGQDTVLEVER